MKPLYAPPDKNVRSTSDLDLDLPIEPGFISHLAPVNIDVILQQNKWLAEQFNSLPDAEKRRLRSKCDVEFVL
jgi:hypothetical protein